MAMILLSMAMIGCRKYECVCQGEIYVNNKGVSGTYENHGSDLTLCQNHLGEDTVKNNDSTFTIQMCAIPK